VYYREGRREVQFHWWQTPTLLPVQWQGRLELLRWGSKGRRAVLPFGPWVSEDQLAAGVFAAARPEPVVVPALLACDNEAWVVLNVGVRGVVVRDRSGPVVYLVVKPAGNYYRNLSGQQPVMPVFVNQVI
jgi:hypothetical protein